MTLNTKREFLEIWQEENPFSPIFPWRVQLYEYVGQFSTEEKAKAYAGMVQEHINKRKRTK